LNKKPHVFFDLDHTLWDFESNSKATLIQLFDELNLEQLGILNAESFVSTYLEVNDHYWQLYRQRGDLPVLSKN
jgi:putative hydrolase of the HAD superfamily